MVGRLPTAYSMKKDVMTEVAQVTGDGEDKYLSASSEQLVASRRVFVRRLDRMEKIRGEYSASISLRKWSSLSFARAT